MGYVRSPSYGRSRHQEILLEAASIPRERNRNFSTLVLAQTNELVEKGPNGCFQKLRVPKMDGL